MHEGHHLLTVDGNSDVRRCQDISLLVVCIHVVELSGTIRNPGKAKPRELFGKHVFGEIPPFVFMCRFVSGNGFQVIQVEALNSYLVFVCPCHIEALQDFCLVRNCVCLQCQPFHVTV